MKCTRIAHGNPYALVALGTACTVPISYLVLFTTKQGVGLVALVFFLEVLEKLTVEAVSRCRLSYSSTIWAFQTG